MAVTIAPTRPLDRPDLRFALRFLGLAVLVLVAWSALEPTWRLLRAATAAVVAVVADLTGLPAAVHSSDIVVFSPTGRPPFSYRVADECTGIAVAVTYLIAVAAYPVGRRLRLVGLAGVLLLALLNVTRLVVLAWIGAYQRSAFDAIHIYWWQAFYVAGAGFVWFSWAWLVGNTKPGAPREVPPAEGRRRLVAAGASGGLALLAMAAIGMWAHGSSAYNTVLRATRSYVVAALWSDSFRVEWPASAEFREYGLMAAVVALFLAAPGMDWRSRLRGALLLGLPVVFVMQVLRPVAHLTLMTGGTRGADGVVIGAIEPVAWAVHLGVTLVAWQAWFVRVRQREGERALRRRAARHGSTHRLGRATRAQLPRGTTWLDRPHVFTSRRSRRRR